MVIGAAIQASALQKCRNGDRPDVLVTPLSLGIGCGEKSEEMSIMIKRNTVLPTKAEKFFYTRFDFQTSILFQILQGESLRGKKNILLGQLLVTAVPSEMECLQKVLITMNVNKFGILTATAMLDSTGSTSSLVLNIHSKADKTTIDRMLTDTSASNSRRESLLAKSDLKNYCLDCLEIMNDHRNEFLESHRKSILTQISGLMQWMGSEEVFKREEYTMLFENLQKLCNPIFKINDNGEPIFMKD